VGCEMDAMNMLSSLDFVDHPTFMISVYVYDEETASC
jgi:hypothetical protein